MKRNCYLHSFNSAYDFSSPMPKAWKITSICFSIWLLLLFVLSLLWYKQGFKGYFSFFDDSLEWLQMDKVGHFFAAFHVSRWFIQVLIWQNVAKSEAQKVGVWGGVIFVSPIELLDGFSMDYGFSLTDILANCVGAGFLWFQLKFLKALRFMPKFSFTPTHFAATRKEMLGSFFLAQLIKDYNGQTYWMSFSPNVFLKTKLFPEWLHISVGYGAENLLGGHDNVWENEGKVFDFSDLERMRQLYFSLDLNLQHLQSSHPVTRFFRLAFSCLKFPFPAVGYNTGKGFDVKWLGI